MSIFFKAFLVCAVAASMVHPVFGDQLSPEATEQFIAKLSGVRGEQAVQSDFVERKDMKLLKNPVVQEGTILFQPPGKFRREVAGANPSLMVSDGETLWISYPKMDALETYKLSDYRALRESLSALTAGLTTGDLKKSFAVTAESDGDGTTLNLLPKSRVLKGTVSKVVARFSKDFFLTETEITGANGDRTVTRYSGQRVVTPKAGEFQFKN